MYVCTVEGRTKPGQGSACLRETPGMYCVGVRTWTGWGEADAGGLGLGFILGEDGTVERYCMGMGSGNGRSEGQILGSGGRGK